MNSNVHPKVVMRHEKYEFFEDFTQCRNRSCDLMDQGYERFGCNNGFVMRNISQRTIVVLEIIGAK